MLNRCPDAGLEERPQEARRGVSARAQKALRIRESSGRRTQASAAISSEQILHRVAELATIFLTEPACAWMTSKGSQRALGELEPDVLAVVALVPDDPVDALALQGVDDRAVDERRVTDDHELGVGGDEFSITRGLQDFDPARATQVRVVRA